MGSVDCAEEQDGLKLQVREGLTVCYFAHGPIDHSLYRKDSLLYSPVS